MGIIFIETLEFLPLIGSVFSITGKLAVFPMLASDCLSNIALGLSKILISYTGIRFSVEGSLIIMLFAIVLLLSSLYFLSKKGFRLVSDYWLVI